MLEDEIELFCRQTEAWGLSLGRDSGETLLEYTAQLGSYREANVVGTRDLSELLLEHVLDSLSCLLYEPLGRADRVADVGSGGGLPAIPIKIARPGLDLTLVEATGKKTRFLKQVVDKLSLSNTKIVNERAEDIGQDRKYREKYAVVTARALAPLPTLSEYCVPLVRTGGCVVAMKALPDEKELEAGRNAARRLGAELTELMQVSFLPELPAKHRYLVVMAKTSETPDEYPRRPGVPRKSPLGS